MPRDTLTRDQIVRAAIELLDADGVEGLSMRRLGVKLGSAATSVYWHVQSKENLIVLAGDEVWGEIDLPDLEQVGWRTAATAMANATHAMLTRHPWLVPAMSTHVIYGPGKARYDDHGISVFEAAGFTGAGMDRAMNTVFTFVLGTALGEATEVAWRARIRREGRDAEEAIQEAMARVSEIAAQFPRLQARIEDFGDADPSTAPAQAFEFGLTTLLDGLELQLADRGLTAG